MPTNDWNERFSKASQIVDKFNNSNNLSNFKAVEIEFGDDSAPDQQKSSPIKKLYEPVPTEPNIDFPGAPRAARPTISNVPQNQTPETKIKSYSYDLDGGVLMTCKVDEWSKGFTLFGDFLRDAKKYYRKTCINANYIYFFSYRPMYRELNHEQLCWYLFWRSRIREGIYPKTGLSYIFLYLYEQINLSDIIGQEKVYENIIRIWKNYRQEFPRIDKYIAEWLIDFSFINKLKINLSDIEDILPDIINIVTIPEVYLCEDFFKNKNNIDLLIQNLSVYDFKKSKFYNEKNKELFDYHITQIFHAVLSGAEFEGIVKKETDDGVKIRTTRESFMGAVCVYEHKKRITVEYKNLYKNFFIRQCITDTVRYAENTLRDYLNIKSKLTVAAYPEQLKKIIDEYKNKYLSVTKATKITVKNKKKTDEEEIFEPVEFNPNIEAAAEIEKSSWDTTMTLVELQNEANSESDDEDPDIVFDEDDGEFIAIDTGTAETYEELDEITPIVVGDAHPGVPLNETMPDESIDIFDVLENLENDTPVEELPPSLRDTPLGEGGKTETGMNKFIASLNGEERTALEMLLSAKSDNKSFDMLCVEFLNLRGGMLESVIDAINEKAMDFTGDIIFDTASQEIIEDYREEIEECLKK